MRAAIVVTSIVISVGQSTQLREKTGESVEGKIQVENLIPVLDVRDVQTSIEFYCDVLGFTLLDKVEWAGRTEWALLRVGNVQLMLCAGQDPTDDDEDRINEGIFFLHVDNPETLIVQLTNLVKHRGIEPEAKIGSKDFYLRDPDGYILWFSHRPPVQDREKRSAENPVSQPASQNGVSKHPNPEETRDAGANCELRSTSRSDYKGRLRSSSST